MLYKSNNMKKGRVLLITPNLKGIGDGVNRIQPSLGLMLIAQVLKDDGHTVKIHDPALEGWENRKTLDPVNNVVSIGQSDEEISKVISNFAPDVIAISVLFANLLDSAHNIAGIAKKVNKQIKVILGGNHISNAVIDYKWANADKNSNLPDYLEDLENENIDMGMTGEGEFSMRDLVNRIINSEDIKAAIKNISDCNRKSGTAIAIKISTM